MANPLDYTVGWICVIKAEHVAAQVFLDEKHPQPSSLSTGDTNNYTLGKMGNHNIVISVLPHGEYGLSTASSVASHMVHSFPNVRIGLMVGIGGGAPSRKQDIRLGDVVVSTAGNDNGGVFQYDFGKAVQDQDFKNTKFLNQPPTILRGAVTALQTQYEIEGHRFQDSIDIILDRNPRLRKAYAHPNRSSDRLYLSHVTHPPNDESSCVESCGNDPSALVIRHERTEDEDDPSIHYGLIASANTLCKDAEFRDMLATKQEILCLEMEAAGLMDQFPCLVIRGICDYSDSHKNKEWQGYAAMTAAAYAKDLLQHIAPNRVEDEKKLVDRIAGLQDEVSTVSKKTDTIIQIQRDSHQRKIMSWLTSVNYGSQQSEYLERRQPGTVQWLLDSATFSKWLDTDGQTLFCPGIPGAGKTIATAIVIHHLETKYEDNDRIGIAYVYCSYRLQEEQTTLKLLMSLLAQLIQALPTLPENIELLYRKCKEKGSRPSLEEVSILIQSTIKHYDKVYILVDALDECQSSSGSTTFLPAVLSLQAKYGFNLFATARPLPKIVERFIGALELEISANPDDVGVYLEARMQDLRSFVREDSQLKHEIRTEISEAVDGMFLLAAIYLESLCDKLTANGVREALDGMRKQKESAAGMKHQLLENAYDIAIERINEQKPGLRELAMQVLAWITLAKRPLGTTELRHALAINLGTRRLDPGDLPQTADMISVCAGLVTTEKRGRLIRLAHYTTLEYLLQRYQRNELFPDADETIARACVTYLTFDVFESESREEYYYPSRRLQSNPFYKYSATYWGAHAREHPIEFPETIDFLACDSKVRASLAARSHQGWWMPWSYDLSATYNHWADYGTDLRSWLLDHKHLPPPLAGLLLATYMGLKTSAERLVKSYDWDSDNAFTSILLCYAMDSGDLTMRQSVSDSFLDSFLDLREANAKCQNFSDYKPLFWTFRDVGCHLLEGVRSPILWIEDGGEVEIRTGIGLERVQCDSLTRQLLKRKEIQVDVGDHQGRTPFLRAVEANCEDMVRLLLSTNRVDVNKSDNEGRTPLLLASYNGNYRIAKMILEAGNVELDKTDEHGRTSLLEAAARGR